MRLKIFKLSFIFTILSTLLLFVGDIEYKLSLLILLSYTYLGGVLSYNLIKNRYLYTSFVFGFHVLFSSFISYIIIHFNDIKVEKLHDFSVFTKDNLQTSLNVLVLNVVIILAVCVIEFSRKRKLNDFALYKNIVSIKISLLYVVIFSSFIFSVFFFTTNITLLDIGYPLQGESQWVSRSILKLPFFLASAALWVLYIKDAYYKVNGKFILNLARTNFIIVSMLILLLIGSRGIFVFLTFLFALFELRRYTASRNLIWFFVFIALMWLMYKGWPYIRVNLHLLPFSEVMSNSFLVMSPFKDMMSVEGGDLVKISQF